MIVRYLPISYDELSYAPGMYAVLSAVRMLAREASMLYNIRGSHRLPGVHCDFE